VESSLKGEEKLGLTSWKLADKRKKERNSVKKREEGETGRDRGGYKKRGKEASELETAAKGKEQSRRSGGKLGGGLFNKAVYLQGQEEGKWALIRQYRGGADIFHGPVVGERN